MVDKKQTDKELVDVFMESLLPSFALCGPGGSRGAIRDILRNGSTVRKLRREILKRMSYNTVQTRY